MNERPHDASTGGSADSQYLERLEFDPKLKHGFFNFFVTRTRVIILMIILLSVWGVTSYRALPLESNPEVKIPIVFVSTALPGSSPGDVEELITEKLESELSALKDVSKITSTSSNSLSVVTVEFSSGIEPSEATRNVRDAVDTVRPELPDDAGDPTVAELSFDDQPILTIVLTGPYDGFALREYGETLRDELERIDGIREARISGGDEREFSVAYDPGKLATLGINPEIANRTIRAANLGIPAGNFDGERFVYPVRSEGRVFDTATLGAIPVSHTASGAVVSLSDIATVEERAIRRSTYSRLSIDGSEPENAVAINIVKKTGGSVIGIIDEAKAATERLVPTFGPGMRFDTTNDFSEYIRRDFKQLTHDFFITLALVMVTLLLIVGLKEAIIAGLAIPLVFFSTFGVMQLTGTSLNFLSLFSLLLSLGLLVDDAIVVVSATKQYLRSGKFTPEEAILLVLRDFRIVLLSTTLATTFAFLPLLLATGIIGEFIKSIPITVSTTLLSSLIIALTINHPLAAAFERIRFTPAYFWLGFLGSGAVFVAAFAGLDGIARFAIGSGALAVFILLARFRFLRDGKSVLLRNRELVELERADDELIREKLRRQGTRGSTIGDRLIHGIIGFEAIIPLYEKALRFVLATRKRRVSTALGALALFAGSILLPVFGVVRSEFFPKSDENLLFINVMAPTGLRVEETDRIVTRVEEQLRSYAEIENFTSVVGEPGISPNRAADPVGNATNTSGITVKLSEPEERDITSYDLASRIRSDLAFITGADITVESPSGGPPAGSAFEARIVGDDLGTLSTIAHDLRGILGTIPGAVGIDISLKEAPAEYTFTLDQARMELYGLDATSVGSTLRMAVAGTEVSTVLRGNAEIDIIARFDERSVPDLAALGTLQIVNEAGIPVFLKDVAAIDLVPSVNAITRIDERRAILLSSGIEGEISPQEMLAAFQEKVAAEYDLPDGYEIVYGGENEENAESVQSIIRAMLIAAILIVSTLVIQFNSFRKALIVLVTLPLALIGVFIGLAIFDVSLSFPGLIGILALFGIVVKNAIILVDKINLNERSGVRFEEAIVDAGKSRLEAIFITSLCTILGILPVTLSNEFWRALGSTIIFGLALSSFLTLFIVPVLYRMAASRREQEA